MKRILRNCCVIALISPIYAGEYTPSPSTAPSTTYDSYSYSWFIGGGGDYMFDAEEVYWNGHIGYKLSDASSLFLEAGWIGDEDEILGWDIDIDVVPVTLNYQYEWALGDKLSWYLGAGLGAANIDVSVQNFGSDDEWTFMAQGFTGLIYEFTPAFEAYLGVRYMWFDEPDFGGADMDDFDDWGAGLGIRFNF